MPRFVLLQIRLLHEVQREGITTLNRENAYLPAEGSLLPVKNTHSLGSRYIRSFDRKTHMLYS